jgi:anti-anti-sigma factor
MMEITIKRMESYDIVIIKDRIDSNTAPELSDILKSITDMKRYKIILDMGAVNFVSSAGLRVFINLQKTCKKVNQGEVIMVNTPSRVYETLELAGFAPLFKFYSNVNSAIETF